MNSITNPKDVINHATDFYDHLMGLLLRKPYVSDNGELLLAKVRLVALALDDGKRFEPDFILLIKSPEIANHPSTYQTFIEPKGEHLIANDKRKEDFLLDLERHHKLVMSKKHKCSGSPFYKMDYMVIGLPFYSSDPNQKNDFNQAMTNLMDELSFNK